MIVMKAQRQRPAFSMVTAIFVIVIMATIGALIVNMSGKMSKGTTFQFRKEQAVLLARSYTEFAIMAATANDSSAGDCTENIQALVGGTAAQIADGAGYWVDVKYSYIGNGLACDNVLNATPLESERSTYIVVDTTVRYRDPDVIPSAGAGATTPWVTYRRRTTQKL